MFYVLCRYSRKLLISYFENYSYVYKSNDRPQKGSCYCIFYISMVFTLINYHWFIDKFIILLLSREEKNCIILQSVLPKVVLLWFSQTHLLLSSVSPVKDLKLEIGDQHAVWYFKICNLGSSLIYSCHLHKPKFNIMFTMPSFS